MPAGEMNVAIFLPSITCLALFLHDGKCDRHDEHDDADVDGNVMPPLTTYVVRGFPSFRDGTSIACPYGTGLSFVLPKREEATA